MNFINEWVLEITRLRKENVALIAMNKELFEAATDLIESIGKACPAAACRCPYAGVLEEAVKRARAETSQGRVSGADAPGCQ